MNKLDDIYRKDTPTTITCWNIHENLRMSLNLNTEGKVIINMGMKKILKELPEELDGNSSTQVPAANHLFTSNQNPDS